MTLDLSMLTTILGTQKPYMHPRPLLGLTQPRNLRGGIAPVII